VIAVPYLLKFFKATRTISPTQTFLLSSNRGLLVCNAV